MTTTSHAHIVLDDQGVAWIAGANTKVIEVVLDKLAHDDTPEEMARQYPHLTLAQILSALSYYFDHKAEMDAQVTAWEREVNEMQAAAPETPGHKKLRKLGLVK